MGWLATGRAAAVTGAGGGIGRSLARSLARAGARSILVLDNNMSGAQETAKMCDEISNGSCTSTAVACDASDGSALTDALQGAGPLDLLCANAGVATVGDSQAPDREWQAAWDLNVMQAVWGTRAVLPGMLERGDGAILITASAAGLLTQLGSAPYTTTKHAAVGFAEWLAITHGDAGINVTCVCPQGVRTPMAERMTEAMDISPHAKAAQAAILEGLLEPDAVADEALACLEKGQFLCMPSGQGTEDHVAKKAADRERWIGGMRRLQKSLQGR
jgi:NAD(P)-dependent dehydrogenase (short-subunit alcohol dehydrogenase family)